MKRIILMALLAMALPMAAFADISVGFTSDGGTLAGTSAGLSLSGTELIGVDGIGGLGLVVGDLGSVTFTTGALTSGSLQGQLGSDSFFAAGGSFVVTGNGTGGIPNTTLFTGSFSGPVRWTLNTFANGTHQYTLSGQISGTLYNGQKVVGVSDVVTINTGKGLFNGSVTIHSSDTGVSAVPEPGTLGLLGTGLIGLAGVLRRRVKS